MNIEIGYEYPHSQWSVFHVFKGFHEILTSGNPSVNFNYLNFGTCDNRCAQNIYSPHVMTIKNKDNGKYFIISYWDNIEDFNHISNGWDPDRCVNIFTSSGVHSDNSKVVPLSYLPYNIITEKFSKLSKPFDEKSNCELFFRGYLYGIRKEIYDIGKIHLTDSKISITDYLHELDVNEISLSLNGAGEICNRDIEILSMRSVLLRPKLSQKFHNEFIDGEHYISFELDNDPNIQSKIILDKFNKIKNDKKLLKKVSDNGYEWYCNNGTIKSNIDILTNIINITLLN